MTNDCRGELGTKEEGTMERVKVKIYGQEHVVAGDKSTEYIERVAEFVDERMKQVSISLPNGSVSELAALAALNITDELLTLEERMSEQKIRNEQLESDTQHYTQLWEEAKRSFLQYKDESQKTSEEKATLQNNYNSATEEADALTKEVKELKSRLSSMERQNENMKVKLNVQEESVSTSMDYIKELETKNKELENSYFDLQMENIQIKGELERYKRLVE
jgi:cell division protein ZapA